MVEKVKTQAKKTAIDTWKALQVLAALVVGVSLVRAAIVTWYNNGFIGAVPVDRIVAGVSFAVVLSYFIYLHYKKQ